MNKQHGDYQVKTDNSGFSQEHVVGSCVDGIRNDSAEFGPEAFPSVEDSQNPSMLHTGHGSIAYELLLLQQRLDAYEQLHIEEMAELREKIEKLRRAFLQETNPHMRILTPLHQHQRVIEE